MLVYRIAKREHASDLSGRGASLYPGRWNRKGTPVIYAGTTQEIALLEILVHMPPMLRTDHELVTLEIPDLPLTTLEPGDLPDVWTHYPAPGVLADLGQRWVDEGKTLVLRVPSCILPGSYNVVINCALPDVSRVRILDQRPFRFDARFLESRDDR